MTLQIEVTDSGYADGVTVTERTLRFHVTQLDTGDLVSPTMYLYQQEMPASLSSALELGPDARRLGVHIWNEQFVRVFWTQFCAHMIRRGA